VPELGPVNRTGEKRVGVFLREMESELGDSAQVKASVREHLEKQCVSRLVPSSPCQGQSH